MAAGVRPPISAFLSCFSRILQHWIDHYMLQNRRFSTSTRAEPNCLAFESVPWISIVLKLLVGSLTMYLQSLLAFQLDLHRVIPPILCLRIFLAVHSEACLQRKNHHS